MELIGMLVPWLKSRIQTFTDFFTGRSSLETKAVEDRQDNGNKDKKKRKNVVVVGYVRTGKSSLCQALGKKITPQKIVDDCFDFYELEDHDVTLIDTPGIGNEPSTDFETFEKVNKLVKQIGPVDMFILTIHGQHPRLGERHQQALRWLTSSLGRRYLKSTVVFFNFWDWDKQAEATRKRSGETEEIKTASINNYFRKSYNVKHDVPVMFLDNRADLSDPGQREKLREVQDGLGRLTDSTPRYSAFD